MRADAVEILPEAVADLRRAFNWYERARAGLGDEFFSEYQQAVARIVELPEARTMVSTRERRCLLRRFPFGVIYQVRGNTVRIMAVADLRRKRGYWEGRG